MLIAGCLGAMATLALHPVGPHGGLPFPEAMATLARVDRAVHGLALVSMTLLFLGTMALTRLLSVGNRLALAALTIYGLAVGAIVVAGTMDGFVGAELLSRMIEGDPRLESWRLLLNYNFWIVTAFAAVYAVGASVAIFLWSLVIVRTGPLAAGLGWYGLALAGVIVLAIFSGHLAMGLHGFGLVALGQSIWFVAAAWQLMRLGFVEPSHATSAV